jgi:hypothetical protein
VGCQQGESVRDCVSPAVVNIGGHTSDHAYVQVLPNRPWADHPEELWRQFLGRLPSILPAQYLKPIHSLCLNLWESLPPRPVSSPNTYPNSYYLRLAHHCRATSCALQTCKLCESDPLRPCDPDRPMADHFCIGDVLQSHCEAEMRRSESGSTGPTRGRPRVSGLFVTVNRDDGRELTATEIERELPRVCLQVCIVPHTGQTTPKTWRSPNLHIFPDIAQPDWTLSQPRWHRVHAGMSQIVMVGRRICTGA